MVMVWPVELEDQLSVNGQRSVFDIRLVEHIKFAGQKEAARPPYFGIHSEFYPYDVVLTYLISGVKMSCICFNCYTRASIHARAWKRNLVTSLLTLSAPGQ